MATTINAYQFEREYPGNGRGEYQTVTEHALYEPDSYNADNVRTVQVEIISPLIRLSTYRSAPAEWRPADETMWNAPCFVSDVSPLAMNLEEAIHLGYVRVQS